MKVHVLSNRNNGLGIAMRIRSTEHDVKMAGDPATGLVPVGDFSDNPDLVINLTDEPIRRSKPARSIGTTLWTKAVDSEEDYARKVVEMVGWPIKPLSQGVNLYITVWFNGSSTILSYATILYRRLMAGGLGPDIGIAGSVSMFENLTDKAQETIVKPLENILKRVSHQGVFHVHTFVNASSFSIRGVSAQLYTPMTLAALENNNLAVANALLKMTDVASRPIRPLEPAAATLYLSAPPYPYSIYLDETTEIKGINAGSLKHLWFEDVLFNKTYRLGQTGRMGHVTARGSTVQEAVRRIYKNATNISTENLQYRNDVGRNINTLIESLRTSGWIY